MEIKIYEVIQSVTYVVVPLVCTRRTNEIIRDERFLYQFWGELESVENQFRKCDEHYEIHKKPELNM